MKVVRADRNAETPATAPIFIGEVHTRPLVTTDENAVGVSLVRFSAGARNVWHIHTADQVLYFVEGRGIVADRDQEHHLGAGDIAHIPAGTEHWHGAETGHDMAHLSILGPSQTTVPGG
jgi:quercetin dioxygenase-like cupin family protein